MPIRTLHVLRALARGEAGGRAATQDRPAKVVLDVRPGQTPSAKPPVRIFIGTEAGQFRAERVLLWSIERNRDPARLYEVYLMKDIAGFRRHKWLTGFTNYRFAIPEFAGFEGRAIYNDVDQIYLEDPANLFDTEMGEHGYLSISDMDTSVMLMDCARMGGIWNVETAKREKRRALDDRARLTPGLWGQLDRQWNARDVEYDPDRSRLVHFTTIHKQPWRPFPREYVYMPNPVGELWHGLEREADAAGFLPFTATRPSPDFGPALETWRNAAVGDDAQAAARRLAPIAALLAEAGCTGVDHCGPTDSDGVRSALGGADVSRIDPDELAPAEGDEPGRSRCVVCEGLLAAMPDADIPWLLDACFRRAGRLVSLDVDIAAGDIAGSHRGDPLWWYQLVAATAARHADRHWQLVVRRRERILRQWQGGAPVQRPPRIWVLAHSKAGHRYQALGLAEAIGLPYETVELPGSSRRYKVAFAIERLLGTPYGLPVRLDAPFPDLVIASGALGGRVARWISRRNGGRSRLALLGRKAGPAEEAEDVVISCRHFRLPAHPRRLEVLLPPNRGAGRADSRPEAGEGRRRLAILVGGDSRSHVFDAESARELGRKVRALLEGEDAAVTVVTSRRTGESAENALVEALGGDVTVHSWRRMPDRTPLLEQLRGADAFVVTGESESMLAEAIATGRPVYIYPLARRPLGLPERVAEAIETRAMTPRTNRRGTPRPQEGLQYICSRLLERGLVLPPRRLESLHDELVSRNLARWLDSPLKFEPGPAYDAAGETARRLLGLLGWEEFSGAAAEGKPEPASPARADAGADTRRARMDQAG